MSIYIDWDKIFPSHHFRFLDGEANCIKCLAKFEDTYNTHCIKVKGRKASAKHDTPLGNLMLNILSIGYKK